MTIDVIFLQEQTAGYADRFLSFTDVDTARDQAAAIKTNELLFQRARHQHPPKRLEKTLMRCDSARISFTQRCRRGRLRFRFCSALRRLKHRPILAKIDNCAQKIFVAEGVVLNAEVPSF